MNAKIAHMISDNNQDKELQNILDNIKNTALTGVYFLELVNQNGFNPSLVETLSSPLMGYQITLSKSNTRMRIEW